ncbi:hypothetical protein DSO57_1029887 [Entomophthora muscae]|uniref:Uncharacterized protein n=1 Tax=Entomophthora muscae TaxID=34485 RepID=A0ACC2TCN0_9FUNG|nr:hypothetical protein DSO57_1029887 [Entomophthora muscae]
MQPSIAYLFNKMIVCRNIILKKPKFFSATILSSFRHTGFYSTDRKSDKHNKFLKRIKNIPSKPPKDETANFKYHPVAVVGVITLLYSLYSALKKKEKDDSYTIELKEEIEQSSASLRKRNVKVIFVIGGPSSGKINAL